MHESYIEDGSGDLVGVNVFCSDACHREHAGDAYAGWNGCHESEFTNWCMQCGVVIPGTDACSHQLDNVVVNRFRSIEGEWCEHGNTIQQPASLLA